MVKFTISFHGRRWLPATAVIDLLGPNLMGGAYQPRGDTSVIGKDGGSHLIDNRESGALMCSKTKSPQALADKDEQTDSEITVSSSNKGKMLRSSLNPYWRGYDKRGDGQVLKLHKRQRTTHDRERSPFDDNKLLFQEQTDKVQGDNAADPPGKEVQ